MKKLLSIFAIALGALTVVSCGNDDYIEKVNTVQVVKADATLPATGGTATIVVTGEALTAIPSAGWLEVAIKGDTIFATAPANPTRESRATHIAVRAVNGDKQDLSIVQFGQILALDADVIDVTGSDQDLSIPLQYNGEDITITVDQEWITVDYDTEAGVLNVKIDHNVDENAREGHIVIESGNITEIIPVTQGGIVLEVPKNAYAVTTNSATTLNINVTRSIEVEAATDADWLTATFNESRSRLELAIAASTEVKREATVTLTSGSLKQEIAITQYGLFGDYDFLFYDSKEDGWYYYPATLDSKGLTYNIRANSPLTIPIKATGDYEVTVGPAGSPLGTVKGTSYGDLPAYLAWAGYIDGGLVWSTYDGQQSIVGEVLHEEVKGELVQYIDNFKGTFGDDDDPINVEGWFIWVCSPGTTSFDSTTGLGYWNLYITPYLEKVPETSAAQAPSRTTKAIKTRNGQMAQPAVLKNILRPKELKK